MDQTGSAGALAGDATLFPTPAVAAALPVKAAARTRRLGL